jgi:outer membrane lipoprotein carrier protein
MKSLFFYIILCVLSSPLIAGGHTSAGLDVSRDKDNISDGDTSSTDALRTLLSNVNSLDTRFEQTVYSIEGDILQQTTGHLMAVRPGKVRWVTAPPIEQLVVSDSETLWIYDPDLEQVSIRAFDQDLSKTPAVLFIGNLENLELSYDISQQQGETTEFTLVPTATDSLYEKVALGFINKIPVSMTLWDSLGQKTKITFQGLQLNEPIDPTLFHFDPPEGIDILRDE